MILMSSPLRKSEQMDIVIQEKYSEGDGWTNPLEGHKARDL